MALSAAQSIHGHLALDAIASRRSRTGCLGRTHPLSSPAPAKKPIASIGILEQCRVVQTGRHSSFTCTSSDATGSISSALQNSQPLHGRAVAKSLGGRLQVLTAGNGSIGVHFGGRSRGLRLTQLVTVSAVDDNGGSERGEEGPEDKVKREERVEEVVPGNSRDEAVADRVARDGKVISEALEALRDPLASTSEEALERGAVSEEAAEENADSRKEDKLDSDEMDARTEQASGEGAASGESEEDRWWDEGFSSLAEKGIAERQEEVREFERELQREIETLPEGRQSIVDERLRDPNKVPAFAPEQLGGGAFPDPSAGGGDEEEPEEPPGRKLPRSGFLVDDLTKSGMVEIVGRGVISGPEVLVNRPRRSQKRLLLKLFQGLEAGVKTAVTDPMALLALCWFFTRHQIQRILDWTNSGVWYSRPLKLGALFLLSLPLLAQLFVVVSYPLIYAIDFLNFLLAGDPLGSVGFAAQLALIYYPITLSGLAAAAGLIGTCQLAISRRTNKISRPFTPQLLQLVAVSWYLIMVPGLLIYKTAIGWVGFLTAFYVSFFIKSAIARFVGYTVQRTEGDPQWDLNVAPPREFDPEWRIMPRTATRVVFGLSVVSLHYLAMLESAQWNKLFFARLPVWVKLIHTIGSLWLLTFCYYVNTHSSDFIRDYFEQYVVPKEIIKDGLYRYVRHPIYAAYMLLFVAYAIAMRAPVSAALFGAISFWYYNIRVDVEEAKMIGRFKQDYLDYIKEVPYRFWLGVY